MTMTTGRAYYHPATHYTHERRTIGAESREILVFHPRPPILSGYQLSAHEVERVAERHEPSA